MTNTPVYDHNTIKVMAEIEHIQHNRGMYIGETELATHLVTEAFDNAIDEAKAGHASIIAVLVDTKTQTYSVLDNGRGIPIENDTIKTVASKLFSGGKFNKGEGEAYGIASGRRGVGIVAVTALSDYFIIEVHRDGKHAEYKWEKAHLVSDIHKDVEVGDASLPFSTKLQFKPSKEYFDSTDIDINYIRRRMKIASVHIPKLRLVLKVDGQKEVINCDLDTFFKDELMNGDKKGVTPKKKLTTKIKDEELNVYWCYSMESTKTPKHVGCVNFLAVDQGTHANKTYDLFRDVFAEFAKKEKMTFNKQDALIGLRVYTSLMLYDPAYSSQTKEKLSTSKKELEGLYAILKKQLITSLEKDEKLKMELLSFFDSYRKKLDSSKSIIKTSGTVTRLNSVIGSNLRDCTTHSVTDSELFIVEGTSAAGTLLQCRNVKVHAVLGLKGKSIPNVAAGGAGAKNIAKNNEVTNIVNACGTGFEPDFDYSGLRYGKIIFTCDADADGSHISSLLMVLFLKMLPKLIENGNVYIAIMPLYGATKGKKFQPFYSEDDKDTFVKANPKIQLNRFKGLGEMEPDELYTCLMDHNTRKLQQITTPQDLDAVYKLMIDPAQKRKLV